MKTKNLKIVLALIFSLSTWSELTWAQASAPAGSTTPSNNNFGSVFYGMPSAVPTIPTDGSTIQSNGNNSSGKNTMGMVLGVAGIGAAGVLAYKSCPNNVPMCALGVAGVVVGIVVVKNMSDAKKTSDATVAAVTVPNGPTDPGVGNPNPNNDPGVTNPYTNTSAWQDGQKGLQAAKDAGWKVSPDGTITSPDGQSFPAGTFNSPASMSAAGFSADQVKQLVAAQNALRADAEKRAKGIDANSFFDSDGGGGAKSGTAVAGGGPGLGGSARAGRGGVGINRDPAQTAGLSVNYNGEPIGVGSDSLFGIIDRRYEWHEKNGSFLNGP